MTLEELLDAGAAQAEQIVRDSRQLDYAHLQGREAFSALIDTMAKRDPFNVSGHSGTSDAGSDG